jgi:hypothetical protein
MEICGSCKHFERQIEDQNKGLCSGVVVLTDRRASECPRNAYQRNIGDWLLPPFNNIIDNIKTNIRKYLEKQIDLQLFTPHGWGHSENVEKMMALIIISATGSKPLYGNV